MSSSVTPLPVDSIPQSALSAGLTMLSVKAKVFGLSGYNSKATAQFIQLHDTTSLPADGAIPVRNITVAATSNFEIDFGFHGMDFQNGVTVCTSSTAATKTIGSADCQSYVRCQLL